MPKIKISVLLIFIIIFSCSLNNQFQDKEQLLKKELYKWKTFQIDGVVEINYKTLRFRKDIQILKNENFLKITLFESGIFGLSPTPFLYFYSDSLKTEFKITGKKRTLPALIDGRKFVSLLAIKLSAKNIKEIIDSGKLHYQGAMVYFDGKMRINKIKFNAYKVEIQLLYSSVKLNSIIIIRDNKNIGNIRIDRITSKKNITIEKTVS